jgi:hypothetical protein
MKIYNMDDNEYDELVVEVEKHPDIKLEELSIFEIIGIGIGKLVSDKNEAYGDSFTQSEKILKILFPDGVKTEQYRDVLSITRVIDKLFRIANRKDAFGESPWRDICGYSILSIWRDEENKNV